MADRFATVKPSGGDYASLSLWEAGAQGVHQPGDDSYADCSYFPSGLTDNVTVAGWSTNPTDVITIRGASDGKHGGVPFAQGGTGFFVTSALATIRMGTEVQNYVLQDIEVEASGADPAIDASTNTVSTNVSIIRCIARHTNPVGSNVVPIRLEHFITAVIRNTLAISATLNAIKVADSVGATIENCTARAGGPSTTVWGNSNVTCINVSSYTDEASSFFNVPNDANSFNNAGNAGTIPGANSYTTLSIADGVDFVEPSADNYNIQTGGNLDGTFPGFDNTAAGYTDDIAENTRVVPWEIGAYEIAGGPGPTPVDVDDLATVPTLDLVTATAASPVAVDGLSIPATLDQVAVTGPGLVAVDDLSTAPTLDQVAAVAASPVAVDGLSIPATLDQVAATADISITVNGLTVSPTLDQVAAIAASPVVVDSLATLATLDPVTAIAASPVAVDALTLPAVLDQVTVDKPGQATVASLLLPASLDGVTGSAASSVLVDGLLLAATLDPVTATASSPVAVDSLAVTPSLDQVSATGANVAQVDSLSVPVTLDQVIALARSPVVVSDLELQPLLDEVTRGGVVAGSYTGRLQMRPLYGGSPLVLD